MLEFALPDDPNGKVMLVDAHVPFHPSVPTLPDWTDMTAFEAVGIEPNCGYYIEPEDLCVAFSPSQSETMLMWMTYLQSTFEQSGKEAEVLITHMREVFAKGFEPGTAVEAPEEAPVAPEAVIPPVVEELPPPPAVIEIPEVQAPAVPIPVMPKVTEPIPPVPTEPAPELKGPVCETVVIDEPAPPHVPALPAGPLDPEENKFDTEVAKEVAAGYQIPLHKANEPEECPHCFKRNIAHVADADWECHDCGRMFCFDTIEDVIVQLGQFEGQLHDALSCTKTEIYNALSRFEELNAEFAEYKTRIKARLYALREQEEPVKDNVNVDALRELMNKAQEIIGEDTRK
jgi:ribosomal protein L37AE/L43A